MSSRKTSNGFARASINRLEIGTFLLKSMAVSLDLPCFLNLAGLVAGTKLFWLTIIVPILARKMLLKSVFKST
ncbi:MAG: hypothetical protein DRQ41_13235 [Gammaproteobacteria bacterium]|nr:MAG: hypothetical protein DRQ41_13235 [Gammaproteobacteria bacterium]RKZ73738.1 MAG: hypothetical protein DRQ57_13365 [Gammaproteobacteria bacterium]